MWARDRVLDWLSLEEDMLSGVISRKVTMISVVQGVLELIPVLVTCGDWRRKTLTSCQRSPDFALGSGDEIVMKGNHWNYVYRDYWSLWTPAMDTVMICLPWHSIYVLPLTVLTSINESTDPHKSSMLPPGGSMFAEFSAILRCLTPYWMRLTRRPD